MDWKFDQILIDPSRQQMAQAFATAASSANKGTGQFQVNISGGQQQRFWQHFQKKREGYVQWSGGDRKRRWEPSRAVVAVVWWSDWLRRRHVRIVSARYSPSQNHSENVFFPASVKKDFLWHLYPSHSHFQIDPERKLIAQCTCGVSGEPWTIGWMGDRCGACHDRSAEDPLYWSRMESERPWIFQAPRGAQLQRLAFSENGQAVMAQHLQRTTGLLGAQLRTMWDLKTGMPLSRDLPNHYAAQSRLTPDCSFLVAPSYNNGTRAYHYETRSESLISERSNATVDFFPGSSRMALFYTDEIAIYEIGTWEPLKQIAIAEEGERLSIARVVGNGQFAVTQQRDQPVRIHSLETGEEAASVSLNGDLLSAELLVGLNVAILSWREESTGTHSFQTGVVDLHNGNLASVREDIGTRHFSVVAPEEDVVATVTRQASSQQASTMPGEILLWNPCQIDSRVTLQWHASGIESVAFSPDGRWMATGEVSGSIRLWSWPSLRAAYHSVLLLNSQEEN